MVRPLTRGPLRQGAAFWGNLDFEPNAVAMDFYVSQVHLALLAPRGVELCIVGSRSARDFSHAGALASPGWPTGSPPP
jgi:hypothetical protein